MAEDKLCTVTECCDPPITCANNDGSGVGVTTKGFHEDNAVACTTLGGTGYTLKPNYASLPCNSNGKQCSATICCDEPVFCTNNDGTATGINYNTFKRESCKESSPYDGMEGYVIKSQSDLATVNCGSVDR